MKKLFIRYMLGESYYHYYIYQELTILGIKFLKLCRKAIYVIPKARLVKDAGSLPLR